MENGRFSQATVYWFALAMSLALVLVGCAGGGAANLKQVQTEKEQLTAALQRKDDALLSVKAETSKLAARLEESEKLLALGSGGRNTPAFTADASSNRPGAFSSSDAARVPSARPTPEISPLPWRPHRAQPPAAATKSSGAEPSRLQALAQRDSRLQYDPRTGVAKLSLQVPFEKEGAALTPAGREKLGELAHWLQAEPAADLRVLVTGRAADGKRSAAGGEKPRFARGHEFAAARALAVTDYLDRHGIAKERLAIASQAAVGVNTSSRNTAGEAVDIYLAEPDAMVVGWELDSSRKLR